MKKMCKKLFCAGIFALTSALPAATPIENDFSVNAATKGMTLGKNAAIAPTPPSANASDKGVSNFLTNITYDCWNYPLK